MHKQIGHFWIDSNRPLQFVTSVLPGQICVFDKHVYYIVGVSVDQWLNYICLDDPERLSNNVGLQYTDMVQVAEHVEWNLKP